MKTRLNPLFFVATALSAFTAPIQAGILYWDGTSSTANADGGIGTWDTVLTNWDTLATAGVDTAWPSVTTLDDDAVFAGTAGTVTVDAAGVTANSLTFNTANYILQGGKITFDGTTPTIANAVAATVNSEISGTGGLTKTGAGALTLGTANTYTGITNISGGSIVAGHVNALPTANTVNISTATGAGTLRLATDSSVAALIIGGSSSNQGTIISDRATAGAGITHVLGAASLGNNTYNFQAGGNVTSGAAGVSLASLNLSAGGAGTTIFNPTSASLTVVGAVGINTGGATKTLELGGTNSGNFINGIISNGSVTSAALSLTKSNSSTWTLTNGNSYSGATAITGGTLQITHASALGTTAGSTTVSSGATLALSGGLIVGAESLSLNGTGVSNVGAIRSISGVNSMSGAVTLAGATRIGVEAGTLEMKGAFSGTQALTAVGAGTLILSGGGTLSQTIVGNSTVPAGGNLEWKAGTGTAAGQYFGVGDNVSASLTVSGGSLTASPTSALWVGSFSSSAVTGTMNVTGGNFAMGSSQSIYVGGGGYNGNVSGSGILNVSNGTFSTGTTTGTFRMGANAASQTGSGTINLSGTGILETARSITKGAQGTATVNFDGGTYKLRAAQATMFAAGVITNVNAGGAKFDTNTFDGTIGTVLAAGSPSGGLTKQGTGILTLTQSNTYTGTTTISTGALQLGSGTTTGSLSTSSAIVNNASLIINRSNAVTQGTDFSSAAITGTGSITKLGAGTLTLNVANSHNGTSIGSGAAIAGGIVAVTHAQALGTGAITINGSNSIVGTLQLSNNIAITTAGAISLAFSRNTIAGGGAAHIQNLSGTNSLNSNLNIASSGGSGANILSTAGTLTLSGNLNVTNGARTYTFSGAGDTIVSGNILVGTGTSNAVSKEGAGTLTLSGNASTYTGGTTVADGTLLANNTTGSATGTGSVNVTGGTLGGTGSIDGAVTINTTGVLSPGASLATGALTLNTGSFFLYELNTTGLGSADLLNVNGNLDLNGTVTLNLADLGSNSLLALGTKFAMISYSGSWTSGDVFTGYADDSDFTIFGNEWRINYNDTSTGSVNGGNFTNAVTLTVIPEPGAALIGGLGVLFLLCRRR